MNLKGFTKIHEDNKVTTLKHDHGHEIRIVKAALPKKMQKTLSELPMKTATPSEAPRTLPGQEVRANEAEIPRAPRSYARGGHVENEKLHVAQNYESGGAVDKARELAGADENAASEDQLPPQQDALAAARETAGAQPAPSAGHPVTINISNAPTPQQAPAAPAPEAAAPAMPDPGMVAAAPAAQQIPAGGPDLAGISADANPTPPGMPRVAQAAEDFLNAPASAAAPAAMPGAAPEESDQAEPVQVAARAPASTPSPTMPTEAPIPGLRGIASTKNIDQQMQQVSNDFTAHRQRLDDEHNLLMEEIRNKSVDPNRLWNSKSTLNKVGSMIGLLLGGITGNKGLLGTVGRSIQREIDNDVAQQMNEKDTRNTLLGEYQRMYGNNKDAGDMMRANLLGAAQSKLMAAQGFHANVEAQKVAFDMDMMRKQLQDQIALRQTLKTVGNNDQAVGLILDRLRVSNPAAAKDLEQRWLPGVGVASIPVEQAMRTKIVARQSLDDKLKKLESFAQQHQGSVDPSTVNQGRTLARDAQNAYREAEGQGVFREAELKFVNSMLDEDPTKFFASYRTLPGYQTLKAGNRATLSAQLKSLGIEGAPSSTLSTEVQLVSKPHTWKTGK